MSGKGALRLMPCNAEKLLSPMALVKVGEGGLKLGGREGLPAGKGAAVDNKIAVWSSLLGV